MISQIFLIYIYNIFLVKIITGINNILIFLYFFIHLLDHFYRIIIYKNIYDAKQKSAYKGTFFDLFRLN